MHVWCEIGITFELELTISTQIGKSKIGLGY